MFLTLTSVESSTYFETSRQGADFQQKNRTRPLLSTVIKGR